MQSRVLQYQGIHLQILGVLRADIRIAIVGNIDRCLVGRGYGTRVQNGDRSDRQFKVILYLSLPNATTISLPERHKAWVDV